MKKAGFTKQERTLITLMRIWMVAFLAGGILFAAAPDYTINYITNIGRGLFGWHSPELKPSGERFWLVLSSTLLFVLAYLCAIVQRNLVRNIGYARPVILAKLLSAIGFALCLFAVGRHFYYLAGAVTDGLIFMITWRIYTRAVKSRA